MFYGTAQALGTSLGIFGADSAQEQYEFFAAVTGEQVGFALFFLENTGNFLKDHVAALVAPGVVDALEVVRVDHNSVYIIIVAAGEGEFAEAPVHKGAAVADLGQRIHGGRLVELSVKGFFACVLEVHLQDHLADLQAVVVFELAFGDGASVYEGAVGAAQVLHGNVDAVKGDGAMPAADQFVVHADVGILAAAQDDRAFFKGNLLELVLRIEYNQVRPHLCDGEFDGVATGNCSVHVLHKCSVVHSKCSKKNASNARTLKTVVYKRCFSCVILFTIKCESTVCLQK